MKTWIQTLSGNKLEPLALTKEMVGGIDEIAHALAHEVRFTRQTATPYSVAEHCVRGADLLPAAFAGAFLLHELSEVYLPDIASPLKPSLFVKVEANGKLEGNPFCYEPLPDGGQFVRWADLEHQHTSVILEALNLSSLEPLIYAPEIKAMDLAMLAAEKQNLFATEPEPWGLPPPALCGLISPWPAYEAKRRFLESFYHLFVGGQP